jgi:phosphoglycerol transferase MdoB-like AlkP superfamily enzyme
MTTTQIKVEKPEGYSAEEAAKIMAEYPSDPAPKTTVPTKQQPNVIAIMNESFSDLGINGELKTSGPYMPYFYSLKDDAIHGVMHASVFGGGTANTEFEFLTGSTMGFIPFRTVPYTIYIRDKTPSLATTMKSSGYCGNIAFHPGNVTSYNRDNVYPNLGFDEFISLDKLVKPERIRAFVSDSYDYKVIEEQYEKHRKSGEKTPFFLFNVTIQNHGQYMTANGMVPRSIDVEDNTIKSDEQTEQFINLMKISDDAFRDLVNYFKKVDEPTVILMFGDHQPNVGDLFFKTMKDRMDPDMDPVEKSETRYKVPFIIWANYDIKEQNNVEISANYLRAYMLQSVGASMTGHDKFLMDTYKQIPVRTANCYRGANGVLYPYSATSPYDEAMRKYQIVQYNDLIDQKNRVDEFFYLQNNQKGQD